MKRIAIFLFIIFCIVIGARAQQLSKEDVARYETEINAMMTYLEETLNFIGDSATTAQEKGIVFTESWSKIFIDDKVQVEDDLDVNRKTPINKDVQAYLKDIDFFFKRATFQFDVQSIANSERNDGSVFFKVTLSRHLTATTINDEPIDDIRNRFVEINLDRQNSCLKIASIYSTKINEKEVLRNWWNGLSQNWKKRLGGDIKLYDSIPLTTVGMITASDFMASYPVVGPYGDTVLRDKIFKNDMAELDAKLKLVTQKQRVDLSGIAEIISVEPLSELSDLTWLDISGTSVDDLSPLRNANKLKTLQANGTLVEDLSALKYCLTLEELEAARTTLDDLSVLDNLPNLQKINLSDTQVSRINGLKNCPNLTVLNLGGSRISNIAIVQDLPLLKSLDISNTAVRDLNPVSTLKDLQSLNISGTAITNLTALIEMDNLRELYCSNTAINDLTPLKNHKRLNKIYCDHSKIGVNEASAFTMNNPYTLVIYDTEALRSWWDSLPIYWRAVFAKQIRLDDAHPTTEQLHQIINLQELDLSGNIYMQNLIPVSRLTNLKHLNIAHTEINFLQPIQGLANLESLNISHTYVENLEALHDMTNLRTLDISHTPITNLTPLTNDRNIEIIIADSTNISQSDVVALKEFQRQVTVIYQTERLMDWWNDLDETWKEILKEHVSCHNETPNALELQKMVDLREIDVKAETPIVTLWPISDFIWLERLTINNQNVHDLAPLANKEYLVELNVQNNPINSLKPIEGSTMLELLNIENTLISDLGPLSKMNNLITLNAGGTPVKSLKPLSSLQKLENLFINNTDVRSLSPIENIASLKQLKIYNTKIRAKTVQQLQQKRLDLNIVYY